MCAFLCGRSVGRSVGRSGRHFGALSGVALCEDALFVHDDDETVGSRSLVGRSKKNRAPVGAKSVLDHYRKKTKEEVAQCFKESIDVLPWSQSWWQLDKYRK